MSSQGKAKAKAKGKREKREGRKKNEKEKREKRKEKREELVSWTARANCQVSVNRRTTITPHIICATILSGVPISTAAVPHQTTQRSLSPNHQLLKFLRSISSCPYPGDQL